MGLCYTKYNMSKSECFTARLPITAQSLLALRRPGCPQIHPGGTRAAFLASESDFEKSTNVSQLWICELPESECDGEIESSGDVNNSYDAHERQPRQITFHPDGVSDIRWSPDGRWLAFLSPREDVSRDDDEEELLLPSDQIWVLPFEGGEPFKVTDAPKGVLDYNWVPDTQQLVYLTTQSLPKSLENQQREEREMLQFDFVEEPIRRDPREFWMTDVEDRKPKWMFTGDAGISTFQISPDSTRLAYLSNLSGDPNDYHISNVCIYDFEHDEHQTISTRLGDKSNLRWAPDCSAVAFISCLEPTIPFSRSSLFVVSARSAYSEEIKEIDWLARYLACIDKGDINPVTPAEWDRDVQEFEWSHCSGDIILITVEGCETQLYVVSDEITCIGLEPLVVREYLSLDPYSSAMVWVEENHKRPTEVVYYSGTGALTSVTAFGRDFLENYALPTQQIIRWKSSDGRVIEGLLTRPEGADGSRLPLVVQLHGGPHGHASNTIFGYGMQPVWCAAGYAVLRPNYRGSDGYGNQFGKLNFKDIGGGDYEDIMSAVDYCVECGLALENAVGVMGGSYGGYLTNWIIGHTTRFGAAISSYGMFHLQTDYSNSTLGRWYEDYLGAYYWEDPELYLRHSPGAYLKNIVTPTLIVHGQEDDNTNIANSRELFQVLKHRGIPVAFVHYPREGHGLLEPNHRLDEMRRYLAWMDKYLKRADATTTTVRIRDHQEIGNLKFTVVAASLEDIATETEQDSLLSVCVTLQSIDRSNDGVEINIADINLMLGGDKVTQPVGIPMDIFGEKLMVSGDKMKIRHKPNKDNGLAGISVAVLFRVPKRAGVGLLAFRGFSPVEISWDDE